MSAAAAAGSGGMPGGLSARWLVDGLVVVEPLVYESSSKSAHEAWRGDHGGGEGDART